MTTNICRLTVGQAIVRFLARQYVERDGVEHRFIEGIWGIWGIFGHGNVAGLGQGIVEEAPREGLRFYKPQHEQAMVHAAAASAKRAFSALRQRLTEGGYRGVSEPYRAELREAKAAWVQRVDDLRRPGPEGEPLAEAMVIGAVNDAVGGHATVVSTDERTRQTREAYEAAAARQRVVFSTEAGVGV
jgi:3D-(3,5/4)-trihydroxycyclohexane-1,2-dione acylhydrolase (decyclizing)